MAIGDKILDNKEIKVYHGYMKSQPITEEVLKGPFLPPSWTKDGRFNESQFIDWLCSPKEEVSELYNQSYKDDR